MGCGQSKIEHEEAVTRCRDRKQYMKDAVAHRNAFAAAHSAYTVSFKNTGAALSDYGEGEVHLTISAASATSATSSSTATSSHHYHHPSTSSASASSSIPSSSSAPVVQPPIDTPLPPPPPPPSDFQPVSVPLQRAASMPDLPPQKHPVKIPSDSTIQEDDDEFDDGHDRDVNSLVAPGPPPKGNGSEWLGDYIFDTGNMPVPSLSQPEGVPPVSGGEIPKEKVVVTEQAAAVAPPPPPTEKQVKKQKAAAAQEGKRGRVVPHAGPTVNLLQVLNELDDHFLKASESAREVSKMLEATRMHFHSNFADNRGHIDHSARVMRVITWNRSCKGLKDEDGDKDDFDNEESETHATVLDKMLAWEKKLYDEVKAGEVMKIEYQRKVAQLNKQKKRGASPETLEKTRAVVSHLHTRYIVDMQSMDSTVSEINRLRDKQLYPKLVDLVDGMVQMWETMHTHHSAQLKIVGYLRNLDTSLAPKETSEQHHKGTIQLLNIIREWHSQFQKLMTNQKLYIQALNNWLKLNLIPIESNLKEKVSFPPTVDRPQIQPLIHAWHDLLEKLPEVLAKSAIYNFSEVVHTILIIQGDELKLKEKCDDSRREYMRKRRSFEDWYRKYLEKKEAMAAAAAAAASTEDNAVADDNPENRRTEEEDEIVAERKAVVESLKQRLEEDEASYRRICTQVREKSAGSLRTHLPELFRAMSEFSLSCSEMYKKLRSITTTTTQSKEEEEVS